MSTRQENQKILMATHLPTFNKLHIIDPYFIAKSAWAPPGETLKIQFFPNEIITTCSCDSFCVRCDAEWIRNDF